MNTTALQDTINQAAGFTAADFVIKNAKVVNVVSGEIELSDIAICKASGMIVRTHEQHMDGREVLDLEGELFAVPGFIDCHVHIESAMVTPQVFEEAVLMHGTTTAFCDPHEISNVLGADAFRYFIDSSENMIMDLMIGLSPCVPASGLETAGATLGADDLAPFINHPCVYGVAEFMSIGAVLDHDKGTLDKLERFANCQIDGHMPFGVSTAMMNAMKSCGIRNCHENTDIDHACEKLKRGIHVFIREGTVCKDAKRLAAMVNTFQSPFLGLCTDDRNPVDIAQEGHIDHVIRTLIAEGADPVTVYRIASWSAANHFGMAGRNPKGWKPRGLIAPDNLADIVLLKSLEDCDIHAVYKKGERVSAAAFEQRRRVSPIGYGSIKIPTVSAHRLRQFGDPVNVPAIGLVPDQVVTTYEEITLPVNQHGELLSDPENDVLYIAVIERHGRSHGNIARSFVKGLGIKHGAIAVSVGHDSHNITVAGATIEDMTLAVNEVIKSDGGKVVVKNGRVLGRLALPVAGLMSDKTDVLETARDQIDLLDAVSALDSPWQDPLTLLGFLPLCVIPDAKITDFGLTRFNPAAGIMRPTLVNDQRTGRQPA